jgi:hypothetical protein
MKIHLAVFDPSEHSGQGSYWSWLAEGLDRHLLDRLYYEVARHNRPPDPNALDHQTIVGGFARIESRWIFGYRFGNGGRDAQGRPGRFVLMVAAVPAEQAQQADLTTLVDSETIRHVMAAAPSCRPIERPENLTPHVTAELLQADPVVMRSVVETGWKTLDGPDVLRQAAAVCAALPGDWLWTCHFQVGPQKGNAQIQRLPQPQRSADREPPPCSATPVEATASWSTTQDAPRRREIAIPPLNAGVDAQVRDSIHQAAAWLCSGRFVSGLIVGFTAAMSGIFLFRGRSDVARNPQLRTPDLGDTAPPQVDYNAPQRSVPGQPDRNASERLSSPKADHSDSERPATSRSDEPVHNGADQPDPFPDAGQSQSHRRIE